MNVTVQKTTDSTTKEKDGWTAQLQTKSTAAKENLLDGAVEDRYPSD